MFCADPFNPENKKQGKLTDSSATVGQRIAGLMKNLKAGESYVFRLTSTNPAGSTTGKQSQPFRTLPKPPLAPREEISGRTDKEVVLKWSALGTEIRKLTLQYAKLNGKDTFKKIKENGGREVVLSDPQTITSYTVKRLEPNTNYAFRLVAYNSSGSVAGATLGPIKTVTFSPDMLDKSGWLYELSATKGGAAKLKRRMSFKKAEHPKYWYTLDGKLLTWCTDVNGEEAGFLHLGKVHKISVSASDIIIQLKPTGKNKKVAILTLRAFTDDPNIDDEAAAKGWVEALVKACDGNAARASEIKQIAAASADDLDDIDGGDDDGGFDEDEDGGFGDFDDDDEDEDDGDGFGGAVESDDDDDDAGFGVVDEDEDDEEASGFD